MGRICKCGMVKGHVLYHAAAVLVGGHGFKEGFFCVEYAKAGFRIEFVPGEDVEVAVEVLDIYGEMGYGLGAIDQYRDIVGMSGGYNFFDGVDGA